jgi:hypothetical protein
MEKQHFTVLVRHARLEGTGVSFYAHRDIRSRPAWFPEDGLISPCYSVMPMTGLAKAKPCAGSGKHFTRFFTTGSETKRITSEKSVATA